MGLFSRRKNNQSDQPHDQELDSNNLASDPDGSDTPDIASDDSFSSDHAPDTTYDRSQGPFDVSEIEDTSEYIDAGALLLPLPKVGELRFSVNTQTGAVLGVIYLYKNSVLQIQPFAAPKTTPMWKRIRGQMHTTLAQHGGKAELAQGPLGDELRALVPQPQPDGKVAVVPHRFIGIDGPRWMLQLSIYGAAAVDEEIASVFYDYARSIVVNRGNEPHPPSELLTLKIPQNLGTSTQTDMNANNSGVSQSAELSRNTEQQPKSGGGDGDIRRGDAR